METLGEDFPKMQAHVQKMRDHARDIGPAGAFYVAVCDDLLKRASEAAMSGDLAAMVAIYQEMRELH
jgi:hypothetical protein